MFRQTLALIRQFSHVIVRDLVPLVPYLFVALTQRSPKMDRELMLGIPVQPTRAPQVMPVYMSLYLFILHIIPNVVVFQTAPLSRFPVH